MRLFGGEWISALMERMGWSDDDPIEHPRLTAAIQRLQEKVEARNFEIRKQVLEYDDVMNKQREAIYALRKSVLAGENLKQMTADTIASVAEGLVRAHADEKMASSYWNVEALESEVAALLNAPGRPQLYHEGMGWRDLVKAVEELIRKAHAAARRFSATSACETWNAP